MQQTPMHDTHNAEVLGMIPKNSKRIIEIGCSSGALAREVKKINQEAHYVGVEIDPSYAERAGRYCDVTIVTDIDAADVRFYESHKDRDCWVFADVLEHLKDPWSVLKNVRKIIPDDGSVVACVPNAQHWSVIARLALGDFRYEDIGLLDRTHLRWFTRMTLIELFESQGFRIVEGLPRVFQDPNQDVLHFVGELAKKFGADPEATRNDAVAFQYVVRAVPA